jgi:regulator of RNase E activity RraA
MTNLNPETRAKLKTVSTATLATALYKRGLRNQYIQDVRPLNPSHGPMVGEAYTLRYIPAREDLNPLSVFQNREHPQRKAVEECPEGAVLVIDSRKDARAASAGSILVTRLMKRGVAGIVTDGGFRDSQDIANLAIPAFHNRPSAPTNLSLHQALDINVPIGCGDAPVFPGDVVVGDADGVIVIPAHLAEEIADEAVEMTAFEDFVTEQVLKGRSILGLYPATDEQTRTDFAAWRKANPLCFCRDCFTDCSCFRAAYRRFPARGRAPPVHENMVKPLEMIADGVDLSDGDRREVGFW